MKNYVHEGSVVTVTLVEAAKSGRPVVIGDGFGIAITDGKSGDDISVRVVDVYELPKLPGAIGLWEKVYWQRAQEQPPKEEGVTKAAEGNRLIGLAMKAAAAGETTVKVRLSGNI